MFYEASEAWAYVGLWTPRISRPNFFASRLTLLWSQWRLIKKTMRPSYHRHIRETTYPIPLMNIRHSLSCLGNLLISTLEVMKGSRPFSVSIYGPKKGGDISDDEWEKDAKGKGGQKSELDDGVYDMKNDIP